jgi:hypothetical protein
MERSLARLAVEDLGDFELEDPRSFELLTTRMAEDMEIAMQVASLASGATSIDGPTAQYVLDLLEIPREAETPPQFQAQLEVLARENARGPLEFDEEGRLWLARSVGQAAYHLVAVGAQRASEEDTRVIARDFVMMACQDLPYPKRARTG